MNLSPSIICKHNKKYFEKIFSYKKRPSYEKKFNIKGKYKRAFYQCRKCKHMYAAHGFNINQLYSKQYLELTYNNINGINERFKNVIKLQINKSDNKNRANRIHKFFLKKKLKLLDVGSGIGVFLFEMKKKNWDVSGIEMDKRYAEYCKKFHKLKVYRKALSKLNTNLKFNLISFNKVLEHVKNPKNLLNTAKNYLKKDGVIYVEVPDIKAKVGGKNRKEFCIDHLHIFSSLSLKILATQCGLEIIQIRTIHEPSGKYTLFGFLKKID